MSTDTLIGQVNLKARLQDSLVAGSPVQHAFLFVGNAGMGKKSFALEFAKIILCQNNKFPLTKKSNSKIPDTTPPACNQCDACRFFSAGTHPDFKLIDRGDERIIKVDRIRRDVVADIQTRPQIGDHKIYLIDMDDLKEQGQNALLKSLEEPPEYAVFLLMTTLQDNLLPTILSRVAIFNFQRYKDNEIKAILQQKGLTADLDYIVQYASGNPSNALQIAIDEDFKKIRQEANDLFFTFPTTNRTELLSSGIDYFKDNKEYADLIFDLWQGLIRDLLLLLRDQNSEQLKQHDLRARILRLAQAYLNKSVDAKQEYVKNLLHAFDAITEVRQAGKVNASFEGMIGQLLLTLRKDLHID
ncbi:MAG: DNA polymerase III subunit [Clostridiaceae bacterium]|nr:DNA polymerase III subunit [Clostridiaceae bacterium]